MTKRKLIIATRESPLALRQTEWVKTALLAIHPQLLVEFLGITTQADKMLEQPIEAFGGKGIFIKELEEALLSGKADIAVHSMKDVPMDLPEGFLIAAICARCDPRDTFVSNMATSLGTLPGGARIGTSSLRRQTQLRALRSDLDIQAIRGNINTRLMRLDEGKFDALVLAAAGLLRMQFSKRIRSYFSPDEILPASGQGALGIECRTDDKNIISLIAPLNHPKTADAVMAERAACRRLGGGCLVPIAAYAEIKHDQLTLSGLIASKNGRRILKAKESGPPLHAEHIGNHVAERLIQQGALDLLKEFK